VSEKNTKDQVKVRAKNVLKKCEDFQETEMTLNMIWKLLEITLNFNKDNSIQVSKKSKNKWNDKSFDPVFKERSITKLLGSPWATAHLINVKTDERQISKRLEPIMISASVRNQIK